MVNIKMNASLSTQYYLVTVLLCETSAHCPSYYIESLQFLFFLNAQCYETATRAVLTWAIWLAN